VVYSRAVATHSAIVTGGGTGIGAAIAHRLSADGYAVTVMGRRSEPLDEVVEQPGEGLAVTGDVGRPEDCERVVAATVEAFGAVDALVNNAGIGNAATGLEETPEQWDDVLRVNLSGAFYMAQAALPHLLERRGSIVNISSTSGFLAGPGWTSYCASKAGLIMLTRCLANDYGPAGVRANCVCPGWMRTPMGDEDMEALGRARGLDREDAYRLLHEDVPARRPADAEEIASVVSFLVGPDASYVNGVTLPADGGASVYDPTSAAFADPA
jgi:meso-butanediol dehydrogenase / (S,S)-butanediol dehydrogenase / diacetyl reductase